MACLGPSRLQSLSYAFKGLLIFLALWFMDFGLNYIRPSLVVVDRRLPSPVSRGAVLLSLLDIFSLFS